MTKLTLVQGDIRSLSVDAIVNAANSALIPGGGVDGAIHQAAGPALAQACRQIGGCKVGQAVATPGFALPVRYIIHAVGPIWQGGGHNEAVLLASCYHSCMQLAASLGVRTLAFPAISCGVYGYPLQSACQIAVEAVTLAASSYPRVRKVYFCAFSDEVRRCMLRALEQIQSH